MPDSDTSFYRTRFAFLVTRLLGVPFWVMFSMLPVILYKDLHITPLQLTLLIALKPMSALLAPYWSHSISHRHDHLISNLAWANLLRYIPFLFLPWMESPWYVLLGFSLYMALSRGTMPAWMEIFKRNFPATTREKVFAHGNALDYVLSALMPLPLGLVLDGYAHAWRWLFPITAGIGILSTLLLYRIPRVPHKEPSHQEPEPFSPLVPWRQAWTLMKERQDFTAWLMGLMLSGAGLMIMQPALPSFFVDKLHLSYTEMAMAIGACKALGVALTSSMWAHWFGKRDIFTFSCWVTLLAGFFPFILIGAEQGVIWLYVAYLFYGVMQAGSELAWHMSGPVFAKEGDSMRFSRANVLMVGLRGCVIPGLGALLCLYVDATTVMLIGSLLCLLAGAQLMRARRMVAVFPSN